MQPPEYLQLKLHVLPALQTGELHPSVVQSKSHVAPAVHSAPLHATPSQLWPLVMHWVALGEQPVFTFPPVPAAPPVPVLPPTRVLPPIPVRPPLFVLPPLPVRPPSSGIALPSEPNDPPAAAASVVTTPPQATHRIAAAPNQDRGIIAEAYLSLHHPARDHHTVSQAVSFQPALLPFTARNWSLRHT